MLFKRAYIVCSTDYHLKKELDHLRNVLQKHNNYLTSIIKQVAKQVKDQNIQSNANGAPAIANELPSNSKSFTLLIPYTGQKGEYLIRSLRKNMHRTLTENVQTRICYTGTKLDTKFNITGPVKKSHQHDVVYYVVWLRNPTNTM